MWVSLRASKGQAALEIRRIQVVAEKKNGNLLCGLNFKIILIQKSQNPKA
jgi:hypothetical protein